MRAIICKCATSFIYARCNINKCTSSFIYAPCHLQMSVLGQVLVQRAPHNRVCLFHIYKNILFKNFKSLFSPGFESPKGCFGNRCIEISKVLPIRAPTP